MTRRERLERKIEKREEWAEKAAKRSDAAFAGVQRIADAIPFGQPILVGHHSERHARRDAERIDRGMRRAVELDKLASHHRGAAIGLEQQLERSIFSDDPDAIERLEEKAAELEAKRDRMKLVNRLFKKGDAAGLAELGIDIERLRAKLAEAGPYWGSRPHLPYELTNLGAEIRRARKRIEEVKARQATVARAEAAPAGVLVERHTAANWCRVTFAERPERDVLSELKAAGYRWGGGSWSGYLDRLPAVVAELEAAA